MFELFFFIILVAVVVYLISLIPLPAPFQQIILAVGIIVCVVAAFQFLFGMDVAGHFRNRYFH